LLVKRLRIAECRWWAPGVVLTALVCAALLVSCDQTSYGLDYDGEGGGSALDSFSLFVRDTTTVRAILDTNELYSISVEQVTAVNSSGRIATFELSNNTLPNLTSRSLVHTIPAIVESLDVLRALIVAHTGLRHIAPQTGRLDSLRIIKLHHNLLDSIPASLADLQNLHTLYLFQNELCTLPGGLGKAGELRVLELRDNLLESLPESLLESSLLQLTVANNRLCSVPEKISAWLDTTAYSLRGWEQTQQCGSDG
jgi:Leucine-rich repeat (LRR) protein